MPLNPYAIRVHVDGSCYKNPGGNSGCAAIVHYPDHLTRQDSQIVDFGCGESNINRMELMACIKALEWVRENRPWDGVECIQIVSDSLYVKDNVFRARVWKKNEWRNRHDKPMANHDLWKKLISAQHKAGMKVEFVWEPGKTTAIGKTVDKAAKAAAKRGGTDVDRGYKPGRVTRSMLKGVAQPYPAQSQEDVIRPYVKKLMFKGENRISFETFDESTKTFRAKWYAFATPVMAVDLHCWHGYRVRFNDDLHYPRIVEFLEEVALSKTLALESKAE